MPKSRLDPVKGDIVEVYWRDACASATLGSGDAGMVVRRTLGYYCGWKQQKMGQKEYRCRVLAPTTDGPDLIPSDGYHALPIENVMWVRVLDRKGDHENAFKAWSDGRGTRRRKGSRRRI